MHKCSRFLQILIILLTLQASVLPVYAQGEEFESLLIQRTITCILEQGDKVIGGLDGGGILIWERDDPAQVTRMSAGDKLSGNNVTALAWTGRYVWVATLGGGMTRIGNLAADADYRQFANNLGSLDITAVTGQVIGDIERVYYGMDGGGLGLITDGLSGAIYTAEQDGLINNYINDLQLHDGVLFIATPAGISRFANNVFTTQNTGLSNLEISFLEVAPDGRLVAGGTGGVFVWDPDSETWSNLNWTNRCRGLSSNGQQLWLLHWSDARYFNGSDWISVPLPYSRSESLVAGQKIWVGGRWVGDDMNTSLGLAWYGAYDGADAFSDYKVDGSLVLNAFGLDFDHLGTVWSGSYIGRAISGVNGDNIQHITQIASAENDSSGLFVYGANMLAMVADHERGLVYTGQFTRGIVRHDINTGEVDLMYGGTCGLEETPWASSLIVSLETHPDGTLLAMYDENHDVKVRILTDPIHWRGTANWYDVPQGDEGIGSGSEVWDAIVQRNDVIWFAVTGTGLMRWDINGNSAGPDDEITWSDFSDDRWDGPFAVLDGTTNDPTQAKTRLALAPDGSVWFGGNGVTRFSFDEVFGELTVEETYGSKTASYVDGIIDGNVRDVQVDGNGDLWVASRTGLNRIRWGTSEPEIDAFFDIANYFSNSLYSTLYSPNVISGLPGGVYSQLASSADGTRMALSSDRGTVAWDLTSAPGEEEETQSSIYCYPNPWTPESADSKLKLGGLSADAVNGDPAVVVIYDLTGQIVYKSSSVSAGGDGFWLGNNRVGTPVATGMYVVKVTWRGETTVRTLAVVR